MQTVTQKFIKNFNCDDITSFNFDDMQQLHKNIDYTVVYISRGVYGVNGCIIQDLNTGIYYKVAARNSALMMLV